MKTANFGAALIGALAGTVVGASATPAHAAAFPPVTFKIVNADSGLCADANFFSDRIGPKPCVIASLTQQWLWSGETDLLYNIGTGKCASASLATSYAVTVQPCDFSQEDQRWRSVSYMSAGERITHVNAVVPDEGWYYLAADRSFTTDRTFGAPNTRFAFTFPTV